MPGAARQPNPALDRDFGRYVVPLIDNSECVAYRCDRTPKAITHHDRVPAVEIAAFTSSDSRAGRGHARGRRTPISSSPPGFGQAAHRQANASVWERLTLQGCKARPESRMNGRYGLQDGGC